MELVAFGLGGAAVWKREIGRKQCPRVVDAAERANRRKIEARGARDADNNGISVGGHGNVVAKQRSVHRQFLKHVFRLEQVHLGLSYASLKKYSAPTKR